MVNRDRKRNTPSVSGIGIVVALLLLNAANIASVADRTVGIIAVALILCAVGFFLAFKLVKKKTAATGFVYQRERAQEKAMRYFTREDAQEKAVKCAHPRGREKYFHQLDNFLANGIIDKNEYRVLKARYEKANIPENMH